jgi:hypothetical protein
MKTKIIIHSLVSATMILMLCAAPLTARAQEGTTTETFDDETLPGWEHSEGAAVSDGVLQIQPENFAVHFTDNSGEFYGFEFKQSGPGIIIFRYAIGEGGEYVLILTPEEIRLELGQEGRPLLLGSTPRQLVSGEWQKVEISPGSSGQQISLDGALAFSTEEETLLNGGGVGFWVEGTQAVEFDNLTLSPPAGLAGEEMPAEEGQQPPPQAQETPVQAETATASSGRFSMDDLIRELTSTQANPTQMGTFLVNLGLAVVLSYILGRVYVHWGFSLSNRRRFSANFILITVTTTFIILIVRSSVALSLGLVGALSIVRFRSAIKEPEELAYLFFAIAIGIGLGDNQRMITVISLAVAVIVLGVMRLFRGRQADFNLHLTVSSQRTHQVELEAILEALKPHCAQLKLMRFDESERGMESSFLVEFRSMEQFKAAKKDLRALAEDLSITFLDNKGIG